MLQIRSQGVRAAPEPVYEAFTLQVRSGNSRDQKVSEMPTLPSVPTSQTECPLSGVERTSAVEVQMSAYDPKRIMAALVEKKPRPEAQRFAESPRGGPRRTGQISGHQIRTDTRLVAHAISARVPPEGLPLHQPMHA